MKRLILILATVAPTIALGQVKKSVAAKRPIVLERQSPRLDGIGRFKINSTTLSIIDELAKENNTRVRKIDDPESIFISSDSVAVCEIVANPDEAYNAHAASCPSARVFYLSSYNVADIVLREIYLTFYNSLLIDFHSEYNSELVEGLTIKYGKPKTELKEKIKNCVFIHNGNKIAYKESTVRDSWDNGLVHATGTIMKWYDSNCKEHLSSYFSVVDAHKSNVLFECNQTQEKIKSQAAQSSRKKKLSEL